MCIQFANNTLSVDAVRSMDSTKIGSKKTCLVVQTSCVSETSRLLISSDPSLARPDYAHRSTNHVVSEGYGH